MADESTWGETTSLIMSFLIELFTSPVNVALFAVCSFLVYKIFSGRRQENKGPHLPPQLPAMKKRDFTLEQLREYDGAGPDGRLCVAVNGKVFDVTRGARFYGQDGPYGVFAGRDASRGLATFSLGGDAIKDAYDDLTDLNSMQMDSVCEWEIQFTEKYDYVGRLLKPGEQPADYTDTEDEPSVTGSPDKSKDD